ncbi:bacteriohemerythrin [Clostridium autoethanogenum]|uniref:Hemerythrin family protein n=1 Tax=Clostridium autoethanogenum DSM 10061 TaxID=1341692 RepID=A0ABN4BAB1_9CLOT|nr:hemerythrin family protein [Clostridium autoethanogenum]AGY74504.1 hemerythrin family protein [Clostridium autoethanogenum DSM 10061]ALU34691.1 Hemerythrin-like metal-binding protein [Clostridium autoethanogenum DSM 10061]OVY51410.1 Bacteriohemerythrin [Clostridium autoethanogenum]
MFEWKDEYACGIKRIDDEHQKLFEIGQSIYELAVNENHVDYFGDILNLIDDLKEYTVYHFEDEEKIMKMYDYPGYSEQKRVHDKFIEKIESLDLDEMDEDIQKSILNILDFVYNWISSHILGMDLKIKDYFDELKLSRLKNSK